MTNSHFSRIFKEHAHPKHAGWLLSGSFLLIVSLFSSSCSSNDPVELNFAFGPDDSGAVATLIKDFNREYKGKIHLNWQKGSRLSNEFYRQIEKDFAEEEPRMDVIAADVVWTSAFASAGWADDLSGRFYENYQNGDFIEASLNSNIFQAKIWGLPWYADAGVLYYRKDLLAAHGFDEAPATWEELRQISKAIMEQDQVKYGYVFQGANYEGGVVNACEFIWNAGGDILIGDLSAGSTMDELSADVNIVTVNSAAAKLGLSEAFEMIQSSVSPPAISTFKELESTTAFAQGDAIFMRNWPTAYARILHDEAVLTAEQIGVAALPVSEVGLESFSCLGGWNLMINSRIDADKKEAAWAFIQFMTDHTQQKKLAIKGGTLPSLRALYEDEGLLDRVPYIQLAKQVIPHTRVRPVTSKYMEISPDIAWTFNEVLKGGLNPTEAVETMQGQMEGAFAAN